MEDLEDISFEEDIEDAQFFMSSFFMFAFCI